MVLCHSNDILGCSYSFYKWVAIFFMPLFFFISGGLSKDNTDIRQLGKRIVNRLLVPYIIWGIIMQICINKKFLLAIFNQDFEVALGNVEEILLGHYLWYVPCLICIEIMNFVTIKLSNQFQLKGFFRLLLIIVSFIYLLNIPLTVMPWHINTALAAMGYYLLGYFYFRYGCYLRSKTISLLTCTLFILFAIVVKERGVIFDIHRHILTHPLLIICMSLIGIAVCVNFCCNFKLGDVFIKIGSNSLFIYIFHIKILSLLLPVAMLLVERTIPNINVILIPIMLVVSVTVCNVLIKPINKYCPFIIGNKKQSHIQDDKRNAKKI